MPAGSSPAIAAVPPLRVLALIPCPADAPRFDADRAWHALDQAAPLQYWELPDEFEELRWLLEARMGKQGRREYIQVLRLIETFGDVEVAVAVEDALRLSAISYDAVKHLVLAKVERRMPRLDLSVYPYLPQAQVGITDVRNYLALLQAQVSTSLEVTP